jgi:hypothetical protein
MLMGTRGVGTTTALLMTGRWNVMETMESPDGLPMSRRVLRVAVLSGTATVGIFGVFMVTGLGGFRGGWVWAPALAGVVLGGTGWLAWGRQRGRWVAAATVALAGVSLGAWNSQAAAFSHGRLHAEMNSVPMPADFQVRGPDEPGGWSLCFDECPSIIREWTTDGDVGDVQDRVTRIFEEAGFVVGPWGTETSSGPVMAHGRRGRLGLVLAVNTRWAVDGRYVSMEPGRVLVTATLETVTLG